MNYPKGGFPEIKHIKKNIQKTTLNYSIPSMSSILKNRNKSFELPVIQESQQQIYSPTPPLEFNKIKL